MKRQVDGLNSSVGDRASIARTFATIAGSVSNEIGTLPVLSSTFARRVPVEVGVEYAATLLDADEVLEVAVERRHQVPDHRAAQHDILVAPVIVGSSGCVRK